MADKQGSKGKAGSRDDAASRASIAARRRRIELRRERQALLAQLDDFGDDDFDLELELLDDDSDDGHRFVAQESVTDGEDGSDEASPDEDDDYIDDDFEDED